MSVHLRSEELPKSVSEDYRKESTLSKIIILLKYTSLKKSKPQKCTHKANK